MKGLLLTMAASVAFVAPDLAPPSMRLVRNEVVVDWPEALQGPGGHGSVRFVVAPTQGPERRHEVVRGQSFPRPRGPFASRARLYAVPADAKELPADTAAFEATGWPSAPLPGSEVHSVAAASPLHRVRTDVVVDAIEGATVRCRVLRTWQFDRDGNEVVAGGVLVPAAAALLGAVLLFVFARRRGPEPS